MLNSSSNLLTFHQDNKNRRTQTSQSKLKRKETNLKNHSLSDLLSNLQPVAHKSLRKSVHATSRRVSSRLCSTSVSARSTVMLSTSSPSQSQPLPSRSPHVEVSHRCKMRPDLLSLEHPVKIPCAKLTQHNDEMREHFFFLCWNRHAKVVQCSNA